MSAIGVVWNRKNEPPAGLLLDSILAAQTAYGISPAFSWKAESTRESGNGELQPRTNISLGGILSNFLPEDKFDRQPIWSADRSSCMVADVRLDNRADLASALTLVHPEKLSDSSLLMECWMRWGMSCLDHIVGGFAFAVWMPGRQELFAARDHAGERPLFYHRGESCLALASMPKGLLTLPGLARGFNEQRLADWLGCFQPDWTKSFFAGIERLPPGHMLRVTRDTFECKQYWYPSHAPKTRYKKDQDYADALLEIFDRATEARLRTTREVGSFLSAGLDSSSVTASAARLLGKQGKPLTAFTAVPRPDFNNITRPGRIVSEGAAAADVARLYPNIAHCLLDTRGYDLLDTMKSWTDAMDEPTFNVLNVLWFTAILDQAKQRGIDVILEGVSGNATISWESWSVLGYLFRKKRWLKLLKTANSLRDHGDISIKAATRASLAGLLPAWFDRKLMPPGLLEDPYAPLAHPELARAHAFAARISEDDSKVVVDLGKEHAELFEFVDLGPIHAAIQAMAQIEVRDPTADKRIYDFCFSIPPEQYVVAGHSRSLVRRAMNGRLPESTLLRYARGRQAADWYLTLGEALPSVRTEMALIEQSPAAQRTLDLPRLQGLLDTFPTSGFETNKVGMIWHTTLTRGVSLGYFLRSHEPTVAPSPIAPKASAVVAAEPLV